MTVVRFLAIAMSFVILGLGLLIVTAPKPDPRWGFMSVQRMLIAQKIGAKRAFITDWDRSLESVDLLSDRTAQISGWYLTKISPPDERIHYQAVVYYEPAQDLYRLACFVLYDEIDPPKVQPCFPF